MGSPFIQHLLAVSHNLVMAELLEVRDLGHEVLTEHGHRNLQAAEKVREKLEAVDRAYADMAERLK
jgi:hypothetical protein